MKRRTYSVRQIQRLAERLDDDDKMVSTIAAIQRSLIFRRWRRGNSLANCAGVATAPIDEIAAQRELRWHVNERMDK